MVPGSFLSLDTGDTLVRHHWTQLPITPDVIRRVHALAKVPENAEPDAFLHEWRPNVPILDLPLDQLDSRNGSPPVGAENGAQDDGNNTPPGPGNNTQPNPTPDTTPADPADGAETPVEDDGEGNQENQTALMTADNETVVEQVKQPVEQPVETLVEQVEKPLEHLANFEPNLFCKDKRHGKSVLCRQILFDISKHI